MSDVVAKYCALREAHRLPELAAAEASIARISVESLDETLNRIDAFKPTQGWFSVVGAQASILAFSGAFERPVGRLLEGEFCNGRASLWVAGEADGYRLIYLSRSKAELESLATRDEIATASGLLCERVECVAADFVIGDKIGAAVFYDVYWDLAPSWDKRDLARRRRRKLQAFAGFGPALASGGSGK